MSSENSSGTAWRTTSYSNETGSCVEVGQAADRVMLRDTKQQHLGIARTVLDVTPNAWTTFTASLRK